MHRHAIDRRTFLQSAAALATGAGAAGPAFAAPAPAALRIEEPYHGAVLNRRHGVQSAEGLKIPVRGLGPAAARVTVNGVPARREGDRFQADVVLRDKETDLVAVAEDQAGRQEARVRVAWDRYSEPRYRFSIDDNSFFLRDICQKNYASLFDCWYLQMLRELNRKYGAKFSVNIYYTTGDDFSLPQFSDRYRGEWRDNSGWLKLAFHAHADKPDRPYQDAPPEKLLADLDRVAEQIQRFAGPEAYAPPTVIHWGMTRPSALQPLATRGVKVLSGFFRLASGAYDVNYRWNDEVSEYLSRHDAWKDFDSGIVFSRIDIVCNNVPVDKTVPTLAPQIENPNTAEILDLFTHEQYFWPFYRNYIPDHPQRLDATLRWVTERGYKPVFFHEGFLGGRES
ncbi:MAG: hypothetical protein GX575_16990 [Candidatus Anammoximicrobium sp.]|nr:hypothetical protein [Candidatus Anammoximicrobium sp.]